MPIISSTTTDIIENQEHIWLQSLKNGEEKGLKSIFDQYYKYLLITASQYIPDQERAKDVIQDVFFELWKNREVLYIKSSLKAYLRRAVVNRSLNYIKSNKRYQWGDENIDFKKENTDITADKQLEINDLQNVINQAIDLLPERCQMIFKLSRMEHLSHKEIAEKLQISPKTIENQITKALKSIRKAVQAYGMNLIILFFFHSFL